MQAVITVVGSDKVGILARISSDCAQTNANIQEVTQTILGGTFAMIMIADITNMNCSFGEMSARLQQSGQELGVDVKVTRQELFDAMHRI